MTSTTLQTRTTAVVSPADTTASVEAIVPAVEVSGLCRRYGRRWALTDVSLQIPRGSLVMVAGRNGAGKSTLFRVLSTAIRPDRGEARIDGFDLERDRREVRKRIALLSHASYAYEALTPMQNLQVAARMLGRDASRAALLPLLEQVGLDGRADDGVSTFSAGMKKRLAIARTLLQDASVILLDEPYGQLDPPGFRFVDHLFHHFRERGATVLIATHQLERGAALCDYGIVLEQGRLAWSGRAADLPTLSGLAGAGLPEGSAS
jgi:heme ABC exporter ATP-binding subunit CcmA